MEEVRIMLGTLRPCPSPAVPIAAALLAVAGACTDPATSTGTIELTVLTDHSTYSLATDSAAEPFLINSGSVPVYLPMNEYVAVQRFEAGAWSEPRPWVAGDGIGISVSLDPGGTLGAGPVEFR